MIKTLEKFGYPSVAAFHRDRNVSRRIFDEIASAWSWNVCKHVLKHPDCPIDIRDRFTLSQIWYVRYVAYFAKCAPANYWRRAVHDQDKRIQNAYKAEFLDVASILLMKTGLPSFFISSIMFLVPRDLPSHTAMRRSAYAAI